MCFSLLLFRCRGVVHRVPYLLLLLRPVFSALHDSETAGRVTLIPLHMPDARLDIRSHDTCELGQSSRVRSTTSCLVFMLVSSRPVSQDSVIVLPFIWVQPAPTANTSIQVFTGTWEDYTRIPPTAGAV